MSWLLEQLRKYKDDRGMMANLQCIFVDSKKHRAWPALSRLGIKINDDVQSYVAGLYAAHPEEAAEGNMGLTCKYIERDRGEKQGDDNKLTPTERRFQHLLTAEKGDELYGRVLRMVLMAKSAKGISVNYAQLENDLKFWNARTKTEWAESFWNYEKKSSEGGA